MRRINDPFILRDFLARLSAEPLTPAQARLLLAARGIRARQKVVEAAVRNFSTAWSTGSRPWQKPQERRPRMKSLDDLPLTPREREIMERLRRERERL